MTRPLPTSGTLASAPTVRPQGADGLLEAARRMPACLFELRQEPDAGFRVTHVGEGLHALTTLGPDDLVGDPRLALEQVHRDDLDRLLQGCARAARERTELRDEFRVVGADGGTRWLSVVATPSARDDGSTVWSGWATDATERRLAQQALADADQRQRRLFESNPVPMWIHDRLTLRFLAVNEAAIAMYGWSREEFLGMTLVDLRHPGPGTQDGTAATPEAADAAAADGLVRPASAHHRLRDGSLVEVELSSQPLTWNGRPARMVGALDVTARRRAEAEIQRLAYYDTLTRLPNRRLLTDRLRQSLAAATRTRRRGAVLSIDLDDFKRVNDTRGATRCSSRPPSA